MGPQGLIVGPQADRDIRGVFGKKTDKEIAIKLSIMTVKLTDTNSNSKTKWSKNFMAKMS